MSVHVILFPQSHSPCCTVHGGGHSGSGREVAASDSQHIFTRNVLSVGESCLCTERVSLSVSASLRGSY